MSDLRKAVLAAWARKGDKSISTAVTKGGLIQICRVTFDAKGKSAVTNIGEPCSQTEAVARLGEL